MKKILLVSFLWIVFLLVHVNLLLAGKVNQQAEALYKEAIGQTALDSYKASKETHEAGIKKLEEVIRIEPNWYEANLALAKAYFGYTGYLRNDADVKLYTDKARNQHEKSIDIAPNRPEAYHYLIGLVTGEQREKLKRKLYEIDPDSPDVMLWKGYDLISSGKVKDGISLVRKSLQGDTEQILTGKRKLAQTLEEKGYHKEAAEIISEVKKGEKFTEGLNEIRFGDVDKGIKLVKESVDGDFTKLPEWQSKIVVDEMERKKRYKEAADIYEAIDRGKYKTKIEELRKKRQ